MDRPVFLIWGLLVGRGRIGVAIAVVTPIAIWAYLWISTHAELYDDGPLDPAFFIMMMVASAAFALGGVALRGGLIRLVRRGH